MNRNCPICGKLKLVVNFGEYHFCSPKGNIVVPDTKWFHCQECKEDIIPHKLNQLLEYEYQKL